MLSRRLIERYVLKTIFPYGLAALVLLTAILFVQQTGRYFESVFRGVMPAGFVYSLALSLLPAVLVFTIPMAVLCGTIIGLGRMSSDSEIVAMRAAGVGTWRTLWPVLAMSDRHGPPATSISEAPRAQTITLCGPSSAVQAGFTSSRGLLPVSSQQSNYVRDGDKIHGQWGALTQPGGRSPKT